MENKELKEFMEILRKVKDTHRFMLFMYFCKPLLESGESVEDIWEAWVQSGI